MTQTDKLRKVAEWMGIETKDVLGFCAIKNGYLQDWNPWESHKDFGEVWLKLTIGQQNDVFTKFNWWHAPFTMSKDLIFNYSKVMDVVYKMIINHRRNRMEEDLICCDCGGDGFNGKFCPLCCCHVYARGSEECYWCEYLDVCAENNQPQEE